MRTLFHASPRRFARPRVTQVPRPGMNSNGALGVWTSRTNEDYLRGFGGYLYQFGLREDLRIARPWTVVQFEPDAPETGRVDQTKAALVAKGYDGTWSPLEGLWRPFSVEQVCAVDGRLWAPARAAWQAAAVVRNQDFPSAPAPGTIEPS